MSGINKVIILGRVGQDPEIRYAANGSAIANISVATSEKWKDKNTGEQKEETEWHRVVLFGKLAEIAGEYLRKGSQVYFEGKNKTRKWTDQQGVERYSTEIVVDVNGRMELISSGNSGNNQQTQSQQQGGYNQNQQQQSYQQQQGGYQQQQQQGYQNQGGFAPQQGNNNNPPF